MSALKEAQIIMVHLNVPKRDCRADQGHAHRTAGCFAAAAGAQEFRGVPEIFSHPKQMLEPLRRCGARLPFPREALDTLTLLLDYSDPADWLPGGMPLVFPGNAELAGCLGLTERSVRNHLRHLQAAGVVHIRRGPGNRRTPVRDGGGRIVEAFGIDLSPVAAFAMAMAGQAEAMKARRSRLKMHMRGIQAALEALRSNLGAAQAVAADFGVEAVASEIRVLQETLEDAEILVGEARRIRSHDPIAQAEVQTAGEARLSEIARFLKEKEQETDVLAAACLVLYETDISGFPETDFRHDSTTDSNGLKNRYSASQESVVDAFTPEVSPTQSFFEEPSKKHDGFRNNRKARDPVNIRVSHIFDVYPAFVDILTGYFMLAAPDKASLTEIADGARILALQMGVSDWCWRTGCARHGRLKSALAVILAAARPDHEIRKSRSALAAGMLLRAPDELNVLKSFHALRKRRLE